MALIYKFIVPITYLLLLAMFQLRPWAKIQTLGTPDSDSASLVLCEHDENFQQKKPNTQTGPCGRVVNTLGRHVQ